MVKDDSNAKKFYLIPGVLSIIFLTWILVYQSIYTYVKIIWNNEDKIFETILNFLETGFWRNALIIIIIFLLLYFILMPIFEGWLIKYIHVKNNNPENYLSKSEAFDNECQNFYRFLNIIIFFQNLKF